MNENCGHCGASLKKYWHKLTPGLVQALVKAYVGVCEKKENKIHPRKDLDLTKSEYNNFQKLRFHALIAKVKIKGEHQRGLWLITKRGGEFLKGRISVPSRVQTFRNKVIGHDYRKIYVTDVPNIKPYLETYEEFKNQAEFTVLPDVPLEGKVKKVIIKRGKKMFCSCGGKVRGKLLVQAYSDSNTVSTKKILFCTKCDEEYDKKM